MSSKIDPHSNHSQDPHPSHWQTILFQNRLFSELLQHLNLFKINMSSNVILIISEHCLSTTFVPPTSGFTTFFPFGGLLTSLFSVPNPSYFWRTSAWNIVPKTMGSLAYEPKQRIFLCFSEICRSGASMLCPSMPLAPSSPAVWATAKCSCCASRRCSRAARRSNVRGASGWCSCASWGTGGMGKRKSMSLWGKDGCECLYR